MDLDPVFLDPAPARSVINWPHGSVSGTAIPNYGAADLDPYPKETFTDPQHWILVSSAFSFLGCSSLSFNARIIRFAVEEKAPATHELWVGT